MSLVLRVATPDDAAQIQEIYAPFCRDTPISFETEPPTAQEVRQRITKTLKSLPWLVGDFEGLILGYAYASLHRERAAYRWSADVSVYVREGHRRAGLGRALYASLFALLRLQGFHNVVAGITLPNPASVGLHEAVGMQKVGVYRNIGYKCGKWHDVGWWQLRLREAVPEPDEPRALPEVVGSAEWETAMRSGLELLRELQMP
jgi:phosphinothricin acetyltransferase